MPALPFIMTNESIQVTLEDGESYTVKHTEKNFAAVRQAIIESNWDGLPKLLNPGKAIEAWAQGLFTFKHNYLHFQGERVPQEINQKFVAMAEAGEDPRPLMRFFQRLQNNPSFRSVKQLFRFISQKNIPIGQDGCILAYKAVRRDYWDKHTGKTFQYKVGSVIQMPRNQISDDPKVACAPGLHVGARDYLGSDGKTGPSNYGTGDLWMIVKVDPADVVSVPYDYDSRKMRVCKMVVVGHYGSDLPDHVWDEDILADEPVDPNSPVEPRSFAAEKLQPERKSFDDVPELPEENIEALAEEEEPMPPAPTLEEISEDEERSTKLLAKKLSELRDYAKSLGIKNVKAIKGGKGALVERILAVEKDQVQAETKHATKTETPKGDVTYAEVHKMSAEELEGLSLSVLRKYARHHLKIVGASKIPGGKSVLLERIADVRAEVVA